MPDQERSPETRRKRCSRFVNAHFRAGNFRCITADKVVHDLCGRQRTHRRQHAKGVTGEKDDIARVISNTRDLCIPDKFYWISTACVFGDARIAIVHQPVLISPAYSVPRITNSLSSILMSTLVFDSMVAV